MRLNFSLSKTLLLVLTSFSLITFTGCDDPEKKADEVFKKNGLNRLRTLNDAIQPGAIILVKNGKAVYADNILDYNDGNSELSIEIGDSNSVIANREPNSTMTSDIALNFLKTVLPVNITNKLKITSDVKIDQIFAKSRRIKIPILQAYLSKSKANFFKSSMFDFVESGRYTVYIAYETFQANKLKITSKSGSDISIGADIGKINPIVESSSAKFGWIKNSTSELVINGDNYYTFALKTAKLTCKRNTNSCSFDVTGFTPTGTLGEDKYANSPMGATVTDFRPIELSFDKP